MATSPLPAVETAAARRVVAPGPAALQVLAEEIRGAQAGDVLTPVTVLVPSRRSALSLRRELAGVGSRSDGRGLVNVGFEVAPRLVDLLGAAAMGERRPLQEPVLREAVRAALEARPASFRSAATHPATIERVARAYRETRAAGPGAIDQLASAGRRGAALARLCRSIRQALTDWYDDADLLEAATEAITGGGPAIAELGTVIWFAPDPSDPLASALLAAFGDQATVVDPAEPTPERLVEELSLVSVSDPDEEARFAVRRVLELAEGGTPLHRIAVAHPGERYGLLLHQHLEQAGVPHHGPAVRDLAHTPGGRVLLGLLELAGEDLSRDSVMRWLASAPIRDPTSDERLPVARWDHESRRAGVIHGVDQWRERLHRYISDLRDPARDRHDHEHDGLDVDQLAERRADRIGDVERLLEFVDRLAAVVTAAGSTQPWAAWAAWANSALDDYVGRRSTGSNWAKDDLDALDQLRSSVAGLGALDGFASPPDPATFAEALGLELQAPVGRIGTFGDGVYVGPIHSVAGLCVDSMIVVGATEGLIPHRIPADPLLGDAERDRAGLGVVGRSIDAQGRAFHLALGTAAHDRTVVWSRGDLRQSRDQLPSRWVLRLAEAVTGRPVATDELLELDRLADPSRRARITKVASFADGLVRASTPTTLADRRLAHLWNAEQAGAKPINDSAVAADPALGHAFRADVARATGGFTEYDGNIDPDLAPEPGDVRPLSATSLQHYAACPRHYLFGRVFGLGADPRPEEITELSSLDQGSLVHTILERWLKDRINGVPDASEVSHLLRIAEQCFDDTEKQGITGRRLPWEYRKAVLRRELAEVAARDLRGDGPVGAEPIDVEFGFGREGEPGLTIDLPTQGAVAFRGSIDRVDRMANGSLVVADYKTGSSKPYRKLEESTVERGELLQLPLYALAARRWFGAPDTPVSAWYWFITEKEKFEHVGYDLTPEHLRTFLDAIDVIVSGVRAGHFPGRPGKFDAFYGTNENCRRCDFDAVCPNGRAEQWDRSSLDPALETYVELAQGPSEEPDAATAGEQAATT